MDNPENQLNLSFHIILNKLMSYRQLSEAALARSTGISQASISRFSTSAIDYPNIKNSIILADFFGVSLDQLLGRKEINFGKGESLKIMSKTSLNDGPKEAMTALPLVEWEKLNTKFRAPKSAPIMFNTDSDFSLGSFAITCQPFMEPRFKRDAILLIDAQAKLRNGQYVIVDIEGETALRKLIVDGKKKYLQENNHKIPDRLLIPEYRILGVVMECRSRIFD